MEDGEIPEVAEAVLGNGRHTLVYLNDNIDAVRNVGSTTVGTSVLGCLGDDDKDNVRKFVDQFEQLG